MDKCDWKNVIDFNLYLIGQMRRLAKFHHEHPALRYEIPVGAHLRHLIEHYEALLNRIEPDIVDYDARLRDLDLQTNPLEAMSRLDRLASLVIGLRSDDLFVPVCVKGLVGATNQFSFESMSTVHREMVFLSGHVVHHFAVIKPHCIDNQIVIDEYFGLAPSTIANQLNQQFI
jgi:hypothetical protein